MRSRKYPLWQSWLKSSMHGDSSQTTLRMMKNSIEPVLEGGPVRGHHRVTLAPRGIIIASEYDAPEYNGYFVAYR